MNFPPSNSFLSGSPRLPSRLPNSVSPGVRREYNRLMRLVSPQAPSPALLGHREDGKPVRIHEDERRVHMHILGASGQGKSKFLEHLLRQDIDAGRGFLLVDPHGELFEDVFQYLCAAKPASWILKHAVVIDPGARGRLPGIDYFARDPCEPPGVQAKRIMEVIAKAHGEENLEDKPQLSEYLDLTLQAMLMADCRFPELFDFADPADSRFRASCVCRLPPGFVRSFWEGFEEATPKEKRELLAPVRRRALRFMSTPALLHMFGAQGTVNFSQILAENKIVLVNLGGLYDRYSKRLLGAVILGSIIEAARRRGKSQKWRPYHVALDEFGQFVTEEMADGLDEMRGFGLSFILAHQHLAQLKEESGRVFDSVLTNAKIKVVFGGLSREDAEIMGAEVFTGTWTGTRILQELYSVSSMPVKIAERTLTTSTSDGYSDSMNTEDGSTAMTSSGSSGESVSNHPVFDYERVRQLAHVERLSLEAEREESIAGLKEQKPRQCLLKCERDEEPCSVRVPAVEGVRVLPSRLLAIRQALEEAHGHDPEDVEEELRRRKEDYIGAGDQAQLPKRGNGHNQGGPVRPAGPSPVRLDLTGEAEEIT